MKLISVFHDYYDTAAAFGIDKTCVYKRTETILKGTFEFNDSYRWNNRWPQQEEFKRTKRGVDYIYTFNKYVIGFCGVLYPCVTVDKDSIGAKPQRLSFFSADKVQEYLEKEGIEEDTSRYYSFSRRDFRVHSQTSMEEFFSTKEFEPLKEEFHKNKCPVFVYGSFVTKKRHYGEDRLVLNPKLKDYRFFQIKDPQTAFQDIFMYLSGVIGIEAPDMVQLNDKQLAKKKGHDSKYSFRKPPGKRGKKQWR